MRNAPRGRLLLGLAASAGVLACGPHGGDRAPRVRHVLLISVDTLRADRLGAYGYAHAETPALDALAARSLRFRRAYAHSSSTVPSVASLLTGRLPAEHGAVNNGEPIAEGVTTLAQRLHPSGFQRAAFVGNYALRRGRGFERGFEAYTRGFASAERVRGHPENPGERLTRRAAAWLEKRDPTRPVFLWVHYQEPHGPYTPPRYDVSRAASDPRVLPRSPNNSGRGAVPAYQWLGHGRLGEYLARYDGEVAETDRQVAALLDALRASGIAGETLIVFAADHGEAFGEDDLYLAHGDGLGEVLVRVPLLVHVPGRPGAVRPDRVRLLDVAPTVLSMLGVEAPDLPGRTLLRDEGDRAVAAHLEPLRGGRRWRSVRAGRYELRQTQPGGRELRDLERGGELVAPSDAPDAYERLARRLETLAPWLGEERDRDRGISERDRDALRALGYVD